MKNESVSDCNYEMEVDSEYNPKRDDCSSSKRSNDLQEDSFNASNSEPKQDNISFSSQEYVVRKSQINRILKTQTLIIKLIPKKIFPIMNSTMIKKLWAVVKY
jgi:hypothetical protein